MPQRFKLTYTDKDGTEKYAAVIHRAPLGSHERFIGFLIEHYGGAFPVWLHPLQVKVLPITDKNVEYAKKVQVQLEKISIRIETDERSETLQAKIRDAQMEKVPYMLVVGDREQENNTVSVRLRTGEDLKEMPIDKFSALMAKIIESKSLSLTD
jgi:threonyl-tRNA synthetase